jgi:group I intron endonuclease
MNIYKITNKVNGKVYVGLTVQGTRTRFLHHLYEARSGSNFPVHCAIRKYGESNFDVETLFEAQTHEELKQKEQEYIQLFNCFKTEFGYNLTKGGDGTLGRAHSEETKDKIRTKAVGRVRSEASKKRASESHKKLALTNPDYLKARRKAANIGNETRMKCIEVYDLDGNLIGTYKSISETSKALNVNRSTVARQLTGKLTQLPRKGYVYKQK